MAMPCMDEPDLKAKFSLSLGHDNNMKALSNMPAKENRNSNVDNEEYIWTSFEDTENMSSYLVAFMASDFECKPGVPTNNNVKFRICSRPEVIEQTNLAAQNGPKILEYYEHFFRVDFPLPKVAFDYVIILTKPIPSNIPPNLTVTCRNYSSSSIFNRNV